MESIQTTDRYDFVVIGGGTAGLIGAKTAAGFKARVLFVERDRPGGDCLWTGCVPSKSLLATASIAADARRAQSLGISVSGVNVDFGGVMNHVRKAIRTIEPVDSFAAVRATGAQVMAGNAVFMGPQSVQVNGKHIRFRQALVATGAAPLIPEIPGLSGIDILTSENIWDLTELPRRLVVLGGGPVGCELGQGFARLGSRVTIATREPRLLPREDPDAARLVQESLIADGVEVCGQAQVTHVTASDHARAGSLWLANGQEWPFDALLVATGRAPRTRDLGLDAAGIAVDERGHVVVDDRLRTTNRWIWAAGDVTNRSQHTHTAGVHASVATTNAIFGLRRTINTSVVPRVTFTSPELAAVGASTAATEMPPGGRGVSWNHAELDRAITAGASLGTTRLALDRKGRVVGATVVGPRAGETIGELTLAIHHRLGTRDIASVTHAYPTYNDALWNAAIADVRQSLAKGLSGTVIGRLRTFRRRWVDWRQDSAEGSPP